MPLHTRVLCRPTLAIWSNIQYGDIYTVVASPLIYLAVSGYCCQLCKSMPETFMTILDFHDFYINVMKYFNFSGIWCTGLARSIPVWLFFNPLTISQSIFQKTLNNISSVYYKITYTRIENFLLYIYIFLLKSKWALLLSGKLLI